MALRINDRLPNNDAEFYRVLTDSIFAGLRVAMPGIIESFSAETQTVTVRPAIREQIVDPDTLQPSWVDIPVLLDVPVVLPRAGGFAITLPIKPGDECLVVFADRCIDAWYSLGDVQNQMELRKHDLSDGFAIVGVSSQPRVLSNYSPDSMQLRTEDGATAITVKPGEIDISATIVRINGVNFSTHVHSDPQGGVTGGPQ